MAGMKRSDCASMCNLINTHTNHIIQSPYPKTKTEKRHQNEYLQYLIFSNILTVGFFHGAGEGVLPSRCRRGSRVRLGLRSPVQGEWEIHTYMYILYSSTAVPCFVLYKISHLFANFKTFLFALSWVIGFGYSSVRALYKTKNRTKCWKTFPTGERVYLV